MEATIENMREHYTSRVFAYSPLTGERYSADPRDYFWAPDGFALLDAEGEPMVLATESVNVIEVQS